MIMRPIGRTVERHHEPAYGLTELVKTADELGDSRASRRSSTTSTPGYEAGPSIGGPSEQRVIDAFPTPPVDASPSPFHC